MYPSAALGKGVDRTTSVAPHTFYSTCAVHFVILLENDYIACSDLVIVGSL